MFKRKNNFCKAFIYDSIKEDVEEKFSNEYVDNSYYSIEDAINYILENKWDDVLNDESYEEIDEDTLWKLFVSNLKKDIDEADLKESLTSDDCYHGLSARERNPFL